MRVRNYTLAVVLLAGCAGKSSPPLRASVASEAARISTDSSVETVDTLVRDRVLVPGTGLVPGTAPAAGTAPLAASVTSTGAVALTVAPGLSFEKIRADVMAYETLYDKTVRQLPGADVELVTKALAPGSFLQRSTTKFLKDLVSRGVRVRENVSPVSIVKVGKIELLAPDTARVEVCASNNLVTYTVDASGAEQVLSDALDSRYTIEEWKFVDDRWKAAVQRSSETQEGAVCDRLLAR
jgi:hypothetical protein